MKFHVKILSYNIPLGLVLNQNALEKKEEEKNKNKLKRLEKNQIRKTW